MKQFPLFLCLTQVSLGFQFEKNLTVREGDFEIASNELQYDPADGSVARPLLMQDQGSSDQTLNYAAFLAEQSGSDERYDLVLYQAGKKRSALTRRVLTRRILVSLAPDADVAAIAEQTGAAQFQKPPYSSNHLILTFANTGDSLAKLPLLEGVPGVTAAEPLLAKRRFKKFVPNDPRYAYSASNSRYQWHLKNTGQNNGVAGVDANIENAWDQVKGSGITIGIVDDGMEVSHPDLAPNANTTIDHDWNDSTPNDPTPTNAFDDHGTACAGVAAAKGDNSEGGTGAAPEASLVGLRLIAGDVSDADEAEAMSWRNDLIQIMSNSWGPSDGGGILNDSGPLVKAALESSTSTGRGGLGTVHTWAAGNGYSNDNVNQDGYANSIYTIAVGAVNDKGQRASYSEPGCAKVISAPSDGDGRDQSITTTTLTQSGSYTDQFGGTSSATPLISGVIALILEKNPNLGWRDVQEVLIQSAVKISPNDPGWIENGAGLHFNHEFGAGNVDATAAVNLAANWENLAEQESQTVAQSAINQAIPENSSVGISTTFDFSEMDNIRAEHVTLTANITHPNRGQLTLTLISPAGTESLLSVSHNEAGADYDDWKMMTVFNWGEDSAGAWTFKVTDTETGQTGTLNHATMTVFGSVTGPVTEVPAFTNNATTSGNVDSDFRFLVRATNTTTSYTALGLPAGLVFDETSGLITGVPTSEGDFNVSLTATNTIGTTNGSVMIQIGPRIPIPPIVSGRTESFALLDQLFEYQLAATNAPTSYSASTLPSGLSFDVTTGILSGIPAVVGSYSITLSAMNEDGADSLILALSVVEPGTGAIAQAVDNTDLFFYDEPGDVWSAQQVVSISGGDAMESPDLNDDESAGFSTEITGPGFLSFQWKVSSEEGYDLLAVALNGQNENSISGELDWTSGVIAIPAGVHVVSWVFEKDGSEAEGDDMGWVDQVSFAPGEVFTTLGEALDYPGLDWRPDGPWYGQTLITNDREDALQSPNIDDGEDAELSLEVTGPGQLSFFYRCDSEDDYDFFNCSLDGTEEFSVSGLVEWTEHTITIPTGTHTVSWEYRKDASASIGADSVWIDQIVWQTSTLSGYDQWANQNFTSGEQTDPEFGQAGSDSDRDGWTNLMEYAFNSSPFVSDFENEPILNTPGTFAVLTYQADTNKTDITYAIQESTDLENWANIPQTVLSTQNGIETRRAVRQRTGDQSYLRVIVNQVP